MHTIDQVPLEETVYAILLLESRRKQSPEILQNVPNHTW